MYAEFIEYVDRYFSTLLPLLRPLVYSNGGPIVAVQVENEYGSYHVCDTAYMVHLRDLLRRYLGHDVVLYTVDNAIDKMLQCGKVDGAHATVDFGTVLRTTRQVTGVEESFMMQRLHQERGPLLNAEFYTGWLDHWAQPHHVINTSAVARHLDKMLGMNASVSMQVSASCSRLYMFHGGTSFGFKSGANEDCGYEPTPTSYDYDAPMTEAGDPTDKFVVIRAVISKHLSLPSVPVPRPKTKMALPPIELKHMFGLSELREMYAHVTTTSEIPLSFERIRQTYQGLLSRMDDVYETMISVTRGQRLTVLVESQGRNAFGNLNDVKGSAYLNGFNLGRYWTPMGPQKALYVPSVLFKPKNILNVVELEQAPCGDDSNLCTARFVDTPEINSAVPMHLTAYNCTP
ncbi:hypothetical protein HPB49_001068 [Dermacentor silvarum]|uniref:Uncharacterized protein n=1 Tax=Dermacentor silvarum TaxID=543639 RepID=A0ACB8CUF8_DERSI|nr:hypothetical protein HPB49_001068 [Dermacentor silvarum]